jgi:hypothetical protein
MNSSLKFFRKRILLNYSDEEFSDVRPPPPPNVDPDGPNEYPDGNARLFESLLKPLINPNLGHLSQA